MSGEAPERSAAEQAVVEQIHAHLDITDPNTKLMGWCIEIENRVLSDWRKLKDKTAEAIKELAQKHYEAKSIEDHGENSPFAA